jgi:hypothetical protein
MYQFQMVLVFILVLFAVVTSVAQSPQQNMTALDDNSDTPFERQRARVVCWLLVKLVTSISPSTTTAVALSTI